MQYGQQAADEVQAKEALFKNFFQNVEVVMRQHSAQHASKWAVSAFTFLLLCTVHFDSVSNAHRQARHCNHKSAVTLSCFAALHFFLACSASSES